MGLKMIKTHGSFDLAKIAGLFMSASMIMAPCFAQDISIGATNKLPNTVSMLPATIQRISVKADTVPVLEYIRGVCRAEIGVIGGALTDSQKIELYKAQAIAAATYLARRTGGATTIVVLNSESFQTYLPRKEFSDSVNFLIDSAVNETNVNNAVFFLGSLAETLYFNATNSGFTTNGEVATNNGYFYNSELRRQITPEKSPDDVDRPGMSQIGAKQLASLGQTGEQILAHYYGAMPPYVKKVRILQDGAEKVLSSWADNLASPASAPSRTQYFSATPLGPGSNTMIQIEFSEEVVSPGAGIQVSIDNQTITGGVRERPRISNGAVSPGEPVERWTFSVSASQLANIADGEHSLQICAAHRFFQALSLDSNPKTMAFKSFAGNALSQYESGCDSTVKFSIIRDLNAHTVNSAAALYDNFKGVSGSAPSTLELNHTISFENNSAGISSARIDGPQGNLWSQTFDPPVPSTSTSLSDLPAGNYTVQSFNSVGAETKTPFKIGDETVSVSTAASAQTYIYPSLTEDGTFYFRLRIDAKSASGLDYAEFISTSGELAVRTDLAGTAAYADFDLPAAGTSVDGLYSPVGPYGVQVADLEGNVKNFSFLLQERRSSIWMSPAGNPALPDTYWAGTYSYRTAALDLTSPELSLMPGAILSNYIKLYGVDAVTLSDEMGFFSNFVQVSEPAVSYADWTQIPEHTIGNAQIYINTWNNPDGSDRVRSLLESAEITVGNTGNPAAGENCHILGSGDYYACVKPISHSPKLLSLMRYSEAEVVFNLTDTNSFQACSYGGVDAAGATYNYCSTVQATMRPYGAPEVRGYGVSILSDGIGAVVARGHGVKVPLNSYGSLVFDDVVTGGTISSRVVNSRAPNGYKTSPDNSVYVVTADAVTTGPGLTFNGLAHLTFKYDAQHLTVPQEAELKLLRVIDPATGKYEILDSTLDTVKKTISADVTGFSEFMVAAPEYADPQVVQGGSVGGAPELEFLAGAPVSLNQYDMSSAAGQAVMDALKSSDKLPLGNVYQVSAATAAFEPSAAIKMRYSAAEALMQGMSEDSLAIYAFSESGDTYKLPYLTLDKDNKVLTARVPSPAYSLYAVLGSSVQAEHIPPSSYPDGIPPESVLTSTGLFVTVSDGVVVSTKTGIVLSGTDPVLPGVETSGYDLTNYLLDPVENTVDISTYSVPIVSTEGTHFLFYFSVDKALNYEFPKGTTIYADGTPPATMLSAGLYESDGRRYIAAGSSITLAAEDPVSNGVASGRLATIYLVGTAVEACPELVQLLANPPQAPPALAGPAGTCTNPLYSEPFTLEEGSTTLSYLSVDKVWNQEREHPDILYADGTAPETSLVINGAALAAGATVNAITGDTFTITAADALSNGVASGLAETYLYVDASPEECAAGTASGGVSGPGSAGSCGNNRYAGPFTLAAGTHTVWYAADDRVGNRSMRQAAVTIIEDLPPVSSAARQEEAAKKAAEFYRRVTDKLKPSDDRPQYKGIYNNSPENRWKNKDFYRPRENRP